MVGGSLVTKSYPTLVTPRTIACQASLSMGFPRRECWSGLPFPSPGHLPDPGIEPGSSALQADDYQLSYEGSPETPGVTGKFGLGVRNEAGQRLIRFC